VSGEDAEAGSVVVESPLSVSFVGEGVPLRRDVLSSIPKRFRNVSAVVVSSSDPLTCFSDRPVQNLVYDASGKAVDSTLLLGRENAELGT
jgi:hypothetical protein